MNSNGTFGLFDNCQKLQCDCVTRCTAIGKEKIEVFEAHIDKALGIVDLLIQADNARHIPLAKIGEIRIRCVQWVTLDGKGQSSIGRTERGDCVLRTFSTLLLACGPENASNFRGTIQFKSPFSTF